MTNNWEDALMGDFVATPAMTDAERKAWELEQAAGAEWCRENGFPTNWKEAEEYAKSIGDC